jgi:hypothetical protein
VRKILGLLALFSVVLSTAAASASSPVAVHVVVNGLGAQENGCVSAAKSFTGRAYCLDGSSAAGVRPASYVDLALVGSDRLNGYDVPTRCVGNGTSGKRIQAVYVHVAGHKDTYKQDKAALLQQIITGANGVFEHSSNGERAPRWVTAKAAGGCLPTLPEITVPAKDDDLSFNAGFDGLPWDKIGSALRADPRFRRTDRVYVAFVDKDDLADCGLGQVEYDSSPSAANRNNSGPSYAMLWPQCWDGLVTAHEMEHTMGAVQPTSPHHTTLGHCWDGYDAMCYADGSPQRQKVVCKASSSWRLFDCGGNDYFSVAPKAGSYLTNHWNSASSQFLIDSRKTALPTPPVAPKVTVTMIDSTHLRLTWRLTKAPVGKVTGYLVWGVKNNGNDAVTLSAKAKSLVVKVKPNEGRFLQVAAVNAAGIGSRSRSAYGETGTAPKLSHVAFLDNGDGSGQVSWQANTSGDTTTKFAVTVDGKLPDGRDLSKVLDPSSILYGDYSPDYLSGVTTASVIKVWARNPFGTTSVTVSHPPYTPPPSEAPSAPPPSDPAPSVWPSASASA